MTIDEQLNNLGDYQTKQESGLYFKFPEGESRVRILTEGVVYAQHFFGEGLKPTICYGISKGCPFHAENGYKGGDIKTTIRFSSYIIDRKDNKIKICDFSSSIMQKVAKYEKDIDYAFTGYPMPYDLKITYKKSEMPANKYSVIASPNRVPVEPEILSQLQEKLAKYSLQTQIDKKKADTIKTHKEQGIWVDNTAKEEQRKADYIKAVEEHNAKAEPDNYPEDMIDPADIPF